MADLIGGHVHSGFVSLQAAVPHLKGGKVRVVAVTTAKRSATIPDVPTVAESGIPGFDVSQWWGVLVPRGTPDQIVTKLHTDFVDLTKLPDIRSRWATLGAEPVGSTAAELGDLIRSDIAKYRKIVKEAKIIIN